MGVAGIVGSLVSVGFIYVNDVNMKATSAQIEYISNNLTKQMDELKIATTKQMDELKTDTKIQMDELKTTTTKQMDELKTTTTKQVDELKTDTKMQVDELKSSHAAAGGILRAVLNETIKNIEKENRLKCETMVEKIRTLRVYNVGQFEKINSKIKDTKCRIAELEKRGWW
jgi:Tfp pilus assembly major pilin PilA